MSYNKYNSAPSNRRTRYTEVAFAHNALKRKRNTSNAIPLQISSLLPESAFFVRLSQFEKRVDATLDTKLERVKAVVNREEARHLCENKYSINLYVSLETDEKKKGEASEEKETCRVLYVYGSVEACEPPKTVKSEEADEKEAKPKLELTDVLKEVTVKGVRPAQWAREGGAGGAAATEEVSYTWKASDYSGAPSSSLKVDCSGILPGTKVRVTWEVKDQAEKLVVPQQIVPILGVQTDTKANIISRIWKYMKLKGVFTNNEPVTVEFTNSTLKAFFCEGEATSDLKLPAIGQKLRKCLVPSNRPSLEYAIPKAGEPEPEEVKSLSFVASIPADHLSANVTEADKLLKKVKSTRAFDAMDKVSLAASSALSLSLSLSLPSSTACLCVCLCVLALSLSFACDGFWLTKTYLW